MSICCKNCETLAAIAEEKEQELVRYRKALEEIEAATKINCYEICGRRFEDCNDTSCFAKEISNIINITRGCI